MTLLVVPDLSRALTGGDSVSVGVDTELKYRLSFSISSVLRARLRWLLDDTYPLISAGARYDYNDCRSGLFLNLIVAAAPISILDKFAPSAGVATATSTAINSTSEQPLGYLDLTTVPLSTLLVRALRQYTDCISMLDSMNEPGEPILPQNDLVRKTEISQTIVAAESARSFLDNLLTLLYSTACTEEQIKVWSEIESLAKIIAAHGVISDFYLVLCSDMSCLRITAAECQLPVLKEACEHLLFLESAGLQHPLALASSEKRKQTKRRVRSDLLGSLGDELYEDLECLVQNSDLIFDFPIVSVKTNKGVSARGAS